MIAPRQVGWARNYSAGRYIRQIAQAGSGPF
jgi:hypothetical protein